MSNHMFQPKIHTLARKKLYRIPNTLESCFLHISIISFIVGTCGRTRTSEKRIWSAHRLIDNIDVDRERGERERKR